MSRRGNRRCRKHGHDADGSDSWDNDLLGMDDIGDDLAPSRYRTPKVKTVYAQNPRWKHAKKQLLKLVFGFAVFLYCYFNWESVRPYVFPGPRVPSAPAAVAVKSASRGRTELSGHLHIQLRDGAFDIKLDELRSDATQRKRDAMLHLTGHVDAQFYKQAFFYRAVKDTLLQGGLLIDSGMADDTARWQAVVAARYSAKYSGSATPLGGPFRLVVLPELPGREQPEFCIVITETLDSGDPCAQGIPVGSVSNSFVLVHQLSTIHLAAPVSDVASASNLSFLVPPQLATITRKVQ